MDQVPWQLCIAFMCKFPMRIVIVLIACIQVHPPSLLKLDECHRKIYRRTPTQSTFSVEKMAEAMKLTQRLESREEVHPSELDLALDTRAKMHHAGAPYKPLYPTVGRLFPGTYYLKEIDDKWRRIYERVPLDAKMSPPGTPLAPEGVKN